MTLYMFREPSVHHQERKTVSKQPQVTVTLCWWPCRVQVVLIKVVSPDDEHEVHETCIEL